jgi:WD40 repeat protein
VSGSADNTVRVWDVQTMLLRFRLDGHSSDVDRVRMSKDDKYIFSGSWFDEGVLVWETRSGKLAYYLDSFEEAKEWILQYPEIRGLAEYCLV